MDDLAYACPMRVFDTLPDPRASNIRHRLVDVLAIALMGVICDADGWDDLEDFARSKAAWFGPPFHTPTLLSDHAAELQEQGILTEPRAARPAISQLAPCATAVTAAGAAA